MASTLNSTQSPIPIQWTNARVIQIPGDCGDLGVTLNENLFLSFTQNVTFQCNKPNCFNPPLPNGIHGVNTLWGPTRPVANCDGQNVEYTISGAKDPCSSSAPGAPGARALTAGHVIHIGSGPLVVTLRGLLVEAETNDESLRNAWPQTRVFLQFLISQHSPAIPDSAETFLADLMAAGDQAYDITSDFTSDSQR